MKSYASRVIPSVVDLSSKNEVRDIFSLLVKERILFLFEEVTEQIAELLVAEMIYLDSIDPGKPIWLYINSPGGSVTDGFAIYDTMNYIQSDVITVCTGLAASMGAFLLAAGTKRYALPNSEIMIHQPSGGAKGQATDMKIQAMQIEKVRTRLSRILAKNTGQSFEQVEKDVDRDFYMTAEEAKEYGLIDEVLTSVKEIKNKEEK